MVRNKLHWDASYALVFSKQRNSYQSSLTFLCFESPTVQLAFQCNLSVPCDRIVQRAYYSGMYELAKCLQKLTVININCSPSQCDNIRAFYNFCMYLVEDQIFKILSREKYEQSLVIEQKNFKAEMKIITCQDCL